MEQNRIVSLTRYKAERICSVNTVSQAAEPVLPEANRLWELLDRNIDLSVWLKAN
jgi:hypothetical protein